MQSNEQEQALADMATEAALTPTVEATVQPADGGKVQRMLKTSQYKKLLRQMKSKMEVAKAADRRQRKQLLARLERLERLVGKEISAKLKEYCVLKVDEVKNDKGEVVQEAATYPDLGRYAAELELTMIAMRQDRTTAGQRKASTGSSSTRRTTRQTISFLRQRNEAIKAILAEKEAENVAKAAETGDVAEGKTE